MRRATTSASSIQHQMLWRRVSTTAGARVERNESFGTAVVPRGSAVVTRAPGRRTHRRDARASRRLDSASRSRRCCRPSASRPYFRGNPDLEPERSRAVEAGIEQRLAGDRVKLEATWFDNRYRDIIGLRSTGGYNSEYFNIGLTQRARRRARRGGRAAPVRARPRRLHLPRLGDPREHVARSAPCSRSASGRSGGPRHSGFVQGCLDLAACHGGPDRRLIGRFVDSDFSSLEPPIVENAGRTDVGRAALVSCDLARDGAPLDRQPGRPRLPGTARVPGAAAFGPRGRSRRLLTDCPCRPRSSNCGICHSHTGEARTRVSSCRRSRSTSRADRSSACSARTARARRRCCA